MLNDLVQIRPIQEEKKKVINWYLGKKCNFECSYCSDYLHDNFSSHHSLDMLKRAFAHLEKWIGKNHCEIYFTGGEPTLNPDFLPLLRYLESIHRREGLPLHKNGSRSISEYLYFFYLHAITISYHLEFIHDRVLLEKIRVMQEFATENNKWFAVNLMFKPGLLNRVQKSLELKEMSCRFFL